MKSGDLLRCSVVPVLGVHRVRLRSSLGRALHLTTFDDANEYSRSSSNPASFTRRNGAWRRTTNSLAKGSTLADYYILNSNQWNIKDKEYEWYKEKVYNPIIEFVLGSLSILDEAIWSYDEIDNKIKKKPDFRILEYDKILISGI